jgi:hypothetical protein
MQSAGVPLVFPIFSGKCHSLLFLFQEKGPLYRPMAVWEDNNKMDCEDVNWIKFAHYRLQWQTSVTELTINRIP